jgi:hypothetical protein
LIFCTFFQFLHAFLNFLDTCVVLKYIFNKTQTTFLLFWHFIRTGAVVLFLASWYCKQFWPLNKIKVKVWFDKISFLGWDIVKTCTGSLGIHENSDNSKSKAGINGGYQFQISAVCSSSNNSVFCLTGPRTRALKIGS